MGKEVVVKNELTATKKDVENADLVISLGGDHTFLRTSSLVQDSSTPIMGITTNRDMYTGALNGQYIDHKHRAQQSEKMLELMEDEASTTFKTRSRMMYERVRKCEMQEESKMLSLNEVFVAEKKVSEVSRYCIEKDGEDIGVFKSSGLIISTGTGSTGWLYGVR